jgi:hypothetical protein
VDIMKRVILPIVGFINMVEGDQGHAGGWLLVSGC